MAYDSANKVLCAQWADNKVVNLTTSLKENRLTKLQRRVGGKNVSFVAPKVYELYGKTMFGVDKQDQKRMHFGGFANQAHFHKWYKKTNLAIEDLKLNNAHIAWNMNAREMNKKTIRLNSETFHELNRWEFYWTVSQQLLDFSIEKLHGSNTTDRFPGTGLEGDGKLEVEHRARCKYILSAKKPTTHSLMFLDSVAS